MGKKIVCILAHEHAKLQEVSQYVKHKHPRVYIAQCSLFLMEIEQKGGEGMVEEIKKKET